MINKLVSSANKTNSSYFTFKGLSFIYIINRRGSKYQAWWHSNHICFKCIIPALIFDTASQQLDVAAKTVYSSCSSHEEELLGICASKCLFLQESRVQQCKLHQLSVNRNNFLEYHHLYKKNKKLSKSTY
jgi:hypothetical protein